MTSRVRCGMMITCACVALVLAGARSHGADVAAAVHVLRTVQPGGAGSVACREAVTEIAAGGVGALMPILDGFLDASPLAENWLRNAWEQTAASITASGGTLPARKLEAFVLETAGSPTARRMVYETLRSSDATIEERLIPGLLLDPHPEFRRDAVARLIKEAAAAPDGDDSKSLYRKALSGAVHEDQVQTIADALRKAGETVSIQEHFGFIREWSIVGPFDNKDEKGFPVAYPPELELAAGTPLDLTREYEGQTGKAAWKTLATDDDYGTIDIAAQIENYKGSLMYATTVWNSPTRQQLEVRLGTPNAWKLWVNGKLAFEREEYHRSSQMDQYRVPVELNAGPNVLVLKVCQNEMTQEWAQRYQFQVRICNSTGTGIRPVAAAATASAAGDVQ